MELKNQLKKIDEKIAKDILVGDFVIIRQQPCVVIETRHSKPGKHVMKVLIRGQNLITRRKMEQIVKLESIVEVVHPKFYEFEVVEVDKDDMVSLLYDKFELRVIKLQDDQQLKKKFLESFNRFRQDGTTFYAKIVKVNEQQEIIGFKV